MSSLNLSLSSPVDTGPQPKHPQLNLLSIARTSGCDLDCGHAFSGGLSAALKSGEINATRLRQALARAFESRMKLGEFDDPAVLPHWSKLGYADINSKALQQLALEAAQQAVVLLRNDGGTLPWSTSKKMRVAVLGTHEDISLVVTLKPFSLN